MRASPSLPSLRHTYAHQRDREREQNDFSPAVAPLPSPGAATSTFREAIANASANANAEGGRTPPLSIARLPPHSLPASPTAPLTFGRRANATESLSALLLDEGHTESGSAPSTPPLTPGGSSPSNGALESPMDIPVRTPVLDESNGLDRGLIVRFGEIMLNEDTQSDNVGKSPYLRDDDDEGGRYLLVRCFCYDCYTVLTLL